MLRLLQHPMASNSGVSAPEARRGEGSSYRNPDSCVERVLDNSCDLPIMEVLLIWQGGKQENNGPDFAILPSLDLWLVPH